MKSNNLFIIFFYIMLSSCINKNTESDKLHNLFNGVWENGLQEFPVRAIYAWFLAPHTPVTGFPGRLSDYSASGRVGACSPLTSCNLSFRGFASGPEGRRLSVFQKAAGATLVEAAHKGRADLSNGWHEAISRNPLDWYTHH